MIAHIAHFGCLLAFASIVTPTPLAPSINSVYEQAAGSEHHVAAPQLNSTSQTGENIFQANCSRCHAAPMSLSPRVTGTIIMHMRVRARLSRKDEQILIKYMAP